MILAALSEYVHWWWYPLLLMGIAAALYLGGRVLHKSLAMHDQTAKPKVTLGRCCVAVFLAAGAACVCGGAIAYLISAITETSDIDLQWTSLVIVGVIVAIPAFALVIVAMFNMPFGQLLPGIGKAFGVVVIIVAICGTAIGVPANFERLDHIERVTSADHLHKIFGYLQEASAYFTKAMPSDLASLKKLQDFDAALLKSPRRPGLDIGYFYYSPLSEAMLKANPRRGRDAVAPQGGEGLIACEFKDTSKPGRVFLMRNGNVQWLAEDEFREILNKKINEDFRKELKDK